MGTSRQNDEEKTTAPLPYVPPQVKLGNPFPELDQATIAKIEAKLHDENDTEVSTYRKTRLEGQTYGRYPKKMFGTSHGIIYGHMGLYAIYNDAEKQKEIAEPGAYGKIKLAKNLVTNEWLVLKTQVLDDPKVKSDINLLHSTVYRNEHEMLSRLELTHEEPMIRNSSKNAKIVKGSLLMKYAKGNDLFTPLDSKINHKLPMSSWPDLFWLHLSIRITEAIINEVSSHDILHGDIKFENIMYDINEDVAHVIDFGSAQKKAKSGVKPIYFSIAGFNAPENFTTGYTEKSEVFALSNPLEAFLYSNIPNENLAHGRKSQSPFTCCGYTMFTRNREMRAFLTSMRSDNADERPTLQETVIFLKTAYEKYKENKLYAKDFEQIDKILLDARIKEAQRLEAILPTRRM